MREQQSNHAQTGKDEQLLFDILASISIWETQHTTANDLLQDMQSSLEHTDMAGKLTDDCCLGMILVWMGVLKSPYAVQTLHDTFTKRKALYEKRMPESTET